MNDMQLRVAAKAVIVNSEGKVLVLREAAAYDEGTNAGRFMLPGGRVNTGEAFWDGLQREIREETDLEVAAGDAIHVDEWRPVVKGVPLQIIGVFVHCRYQGGDVQISNEHDQAVWMNPDERDKFDLPTAERAAVDAFVALRDKG